MQMAFACTATCQDALSKAFAKLVFRMATFAERLLPFSLFFFLLLLLDSLDSLALIDFMIIICCARVAQTWHRTFFFSHVVLFLATWRLLSGLSANSHSHTFLVTCREREFKLPLSAFLRITTAITINLNNNNNTQEAFLLL